MNVKHIFLLALVCLCTLNATICNAQTRANTNNPMQSTLDKKVDSVARSFIDSGKTVGLSIGIITQGKMYPYGYGETKKGNKIVPDANTIFEIGSITKTFTATLLAWYVNEGKISLSDPITKYLPDSVAANKNLEGITVQMLSNHTSGLPRVPLNVFLDKEHDPANPYKHYNKQKMFSFLKACKPMSKPGEKYSYSNYAVGLLGVLLENMDGGDSTYEQLVRKHICEPLKMFNTVQHLSLEQAYRHVSVYNEKGEQVLQWDCDAISAAGALHSSSNDMLLYAKANMASDHTTLGKAISLTHNITFEGDIPVGLGWHYGRDKEHPIIWHNGGTGGSSSFMAFSKGKQYAIIVLSNSQNKVDAVGVELLRYLNTLQP
jgi:CubicO group peptidase (beta-lactamase class C family)